MAVVEQFSRSMIERYLRVNQLRSLRDSDGDFHVEFGYEDETGCELTVLLEATGAEQSIYSVVVVSNRRVPRNEWGRVVALCNEWNEDTRWPKAYFHVRSAASDMHGSVILEEHIDLEAGIHWELFESWTTLVIGAGFRFWKWAHQEKGL